MEHAAIAEAGVIGIPDPVIGEVVKAFVVLKPGVVDDAALRREGMRAEPLVEREQLELF